MAEKVAIAGIRRKRGSLLYVRDGSVWRVPEKRSGQAPDNPESVADIGFDMDPNYIYFVDEDGDVSRAKASEFEDSAEDNAGEDEDEEEKRVESDRDHQVAEAEAVFARVLPDRGDRAIVLKRLLASARLAETIAPRAWAITLFSNGFRLNVGQVEAVVLSDQTLRVNLAAKLGVPPVEGPRYVATMYRSMPDPQCAFVGPVVEYADVDGSIAEAHEAFIQRAASTRSGEARAGTPFRRSHHAGVLELARRFLGVEEPGLFWKASPSSTGRTLLLLGGTDEQNGDYSLLKEVARSANPTVERWSTLKEARAGDEVWFYFPSPHSAIVASGVAHADAQPGENWPYVMPVSCVTWLPK